MISVVTLAGNPGRATFESRRAAQNPNAGIGRDKYLAVFLVESLAVHVHDAFIGGLHLYRAFGKGTRTFPGKSLRGGVLHGCR